MTGFSIDWLDLREAADLRARDDEMLQQTRHWLATTNAAAPESSVVDLGAGTGSTLRAFLSTPTSTTANPADGEPLNWRLVDHDPELLAEARRRHGGSQQVQTYELELTDITALPLDGARLVTASALFDLVSAEFIDILAAALRSQCQRLPVGLYSALNYDGTTLWQPAHPLDEAVLNAFNQDQQRDKGFGPALGPGAVPYMDRVFKSADFRMLSAGSPWELSGADITLVNALIDGIGNAVAQDPALDPASLQDWIQFRKEHALTGTCTVGHTDLLALPKDDAR